MGAGGRLLLLPCVACGEAGLFCGHAIHFRCQRGRCACGHDGETEHGAGCSLCAVVGCPCGGFRPAAVNGSPKH